MDKQLELMEVYDLLLDFFGKKLDAPTLHSSKQTIECILYGSIVFRCGIELPYKRFGAAIILDDSHGINSVFGESLAINNDKESILDTFRKVDEYCRLRLPDKYLEKYESTL